jgi:hypothetical protein
VYVMQVTKEKNNTIYFSLKGGRDQSKRNVGFTVRSNHYSYMVIISRPNEHATKKKNQNSED